MLCLKLTVKYISDLFYQDTMDYPSLSLKQDVIDQAFSDDLQPSRSMYKKKYRKEQKESRSMYMKENRKQQTENMLQNPVAKECDYKTSNPSCMF